nr:MAG TPA: hypothetical protein [Caudoviricetes sp.]
MFRIISIVGRGLPYRRMSDILILNINSICDESECLLESSFLLD